MSGGRFASFALGCFLLASYCSRGADGNVDVSTPDAVEAEVGKAAVLRCNFSISENSSYAYINWFYMDGNERKKIIYMSRGTEHPSEGPFKNRVNVLDDFALSISKVTPQDAKTYVCQVGAGSAGVAEDRTELHVSKAPETPEIEGIGSHHPASASDIQEIAVCVSRNGFPTPTITWFKNEVLLDSRAPEIGTRSSVTQESSGLITVSSTLSAKVTKEDHKAFYHCQVTYSLMGSNQTLRSESFQINVNYPSENIRFVLNTSHPEVKEGDDVKLLCEADGNPPPMYTFFRVEEEETELQGGLTGELTLEDVKMNSSGVYRCRALDLDTFSTLQADVDLFVNYLEVPTITSEDGEPRKEHQKKEHLQEGDNLHLTCSAKGSKPLEFQWRKKGKVITKGKLLLLSSVTHETSGNYSCVVAMPSIPGLSRSKQVFVAVHSKPHFLPGLTQVFVKEGDRVNLTCAAVSLPKPVVSWSTSNGTILKSTPAHNQINSTLSTWVTKELLETGINCTAKNRLGEVEHHFKLEQRRQELAPTANSIGREALVMSGSPTIAPSIENTSWSSELNISHNASVTCCSPDVPPLPSLPGNETEFGYNQTTAPQTPGGPQNDTTAPEKVCPFSNVTGNATEFGCNQTAGPQTPGGPQNDTTGPEKEQGGSRESQGVLIVAVIICLLALAVLGAVLYFLHKKGKLPCGRSGKQEITRPDADKDEIVVEVKSDKPEEAGLLQGANGEKRSTGDQGEKYIDLRN